MSSELLLKFAQDGNSSEFLQTFASSSGDVVNAAHENGRTMLHYFCLKDDSKSTIGCVEAILACEEARLSSQDGQGQTPLHLALKERKTRALADILLATGRCNVKLADSYGRLPLHWCAQHGYKDLALLCLEGVDVNAKTTSGDTPLHWAVGGMHVDVVSMLIANKADVSIKNDRSETPGEWINKSALSGDQEQRMLMQTILASAENVSSSSSSSSSSSTSSSNSSHATGLIMPGQQVGLKRKKPIAKKKMKIKLKAKTTN